MDSKTVLITGASSGIGLACARRLAGEGHEVLLASRRENLLQRAAEEINEDGGQADYLPLDLSEESSIESVAQKLLQRASSPDILVNNAGYGIYGLVEDIPLEEARQLFETNFFGALALTRKLLPALKASDSGRIVNVASGVAKRGFPVMNYYSASKAALESMSECLQQELRPYDITVQVVYPLRTETGFSDSARRYVPEDFSFPAAGPTQTAEEVAEAISRGLETDKFRIHPHPSTKLLGVLNEISPLFTAQLLTMKDIVTSALQS